LVTSFRRGASIALVVAVATGYALDERSPMVTGVGGAAGQVNDSR
jgi:hypothetical protein